MSNSFNEPSSPAAVQRRLASEGAAALDFLVRDRVKMERTTIQRVFHLRLENRESTLPEDWWQVFSDATSSLQLRPSVLDCSVDQVIRLVRESADVVMFDPGNRSGESTNSSGGASQSQWLLVRQDSKSRIHVWESGSSEETTTKSNLALRQRLALITEDERIRCIAFDWRDNSAHATHSSPAEHMVPLTRLRHLLRPEWSDIWLVLVFAFVVGIFTLATPIAVETLVNTVAFGRFMQPVVVLALILFFFLGFSAAIRALQTYIVEIIQVRLFARIAGDLAHRLPRVSIEATEGKFLPELTNRFFDVVTVQKTSASLLLDGIALVTSAATGMAVLGFYHPALLGFDILLLAAITFMIVVLGRGAVASAMLESKSKYYMAAWLEDVARCQTTFHSACGKRLSASRADRLVHDYLVNRRKHFRIMFRQVLFALGLQAFASTVLLGLGGYLVIDRQLTLGQLVAAELIVAIIVGAFAKMGKHFESFYDLLASVDKLGYLFDLPTARPGSILQSSTDVPKVIEMEKLSYTRPKQKHSFAPITASIPAGSSTAIFGNSGAGKSTLLDLIYGVRRPGGGNLTVNGIPPSDYQSDDYWSTVELIRDFEVFSASIEENVHVQRTDVCGTEVEEALQAVGIGSLINAMPEGLQTHLTSSGSPLAPNQVRLMTLARGIAATPKLFLIDGVLDSLSDDEAERVLDYLLDENRDWTIIITTGRRWIAERCHQIIDLPSGTVREIRSFPTTIDASSRPNA